ncbi:MAG: S8 family serine peptidase [Chloroflexi bacterium]|nr:S8 family serine peptidase [Chloroflexota bacterium]MDE3113862.1 S8 family serine peptidase [Chloroflexota bacterium]
MFCGGCGASLPDGTRFCGSCGRPLGAVPATTPKRPAAGGPRPRAKLPLRGIAIGGTIALVVLAVIGALATGSPDKEPSLLGLGTATATDPSPDRIVPSTRWGWAPADRVVVLLDEGRTRADADKVASQLGARVVGELAYLGLYQLETQGRSAADLDAAVAKAAQVPGVTLALADAVQFAKDIVGTRCDPLADPSYLQGANAKAYDMIGLRGAWDVIAASGVALSSVRVGVLDSAYYSPAGEYNKAGPKLVGATTATQFKNSKGVLEEGGLGHGTSVAHMLGAEPENGGVAGVAGVLGNKLTVSVADIHRAGAQLVPQSPADPKDPAFVAIGRDTYLMRTFADAVKQIDAGATVINASFGPDKPEPKNKLAAQLWREFLIRMAKDHPNVVFVAAAGNENGALDGLNYSIGGHPLPNLITVGSLDPDGKRSYFSNYAAGGDGEVTLAADGSNVMVGIGPDGKPILASGTSFATPQVSGAVALLRSLDPSLNAKQIKDILVATASPGVLTKDANGHDIGALVPKELGGRVLRVDQAVLKVVNDLRLRRDPKAKVLTLEQLRALAVVDVKAVQKDATSWTLIAQLPGVPEGGADVAVEFSGQASVGGMSTKRITSAGSVEWPLVFPTAKDSASVTVRRLDSKACARVGIKGAGEVAASPTAPTPKGTIETALVATLQKLGLPTTKKAPTGPWPEEGAYQCQAWGEGSARCSFSRSVRQNAQYSNSGSSATLELAQGTAIVADAQPEESGWTKATYRGLALWSYTNSDYSYGDGLWQGPQQTTRYRLALGTILVTIESHVGCDSRQDVQSGCAVPAGLNASAALDTVVGELVTAGLVPPATLR